MEASECLKNWRDRWLIKSLDDDTDIGSPTEKPVTQFVFYTLASTYDSTNTYSKCLRSARTTQNGRRAHPGTRGTRGLGRVFAYTRRNQPVRTTTLCPPPSDTLWLLLELPAPDWVFYSWQRRQAGAKARGGRRI
jgi:hypothetical protein